MPGVTGPIARPATTVPDYLKLAAWEIHVLGIDGIFLTIDQSVVEINMTESLLSPSTQTTVRINDKIHSIPVKNLDFFAGRKTDVAATRPILKELGYPYPALKNQQIIYRISDRQPISEQIEKYNMHLCDPTLLTNSSERVSKSWECITPDRVVTDVLKNCVGAERIDVEVTGPARPYIAENIHPFQVIAQQADVALFNGTDPCFIHYMSYFNGGTHHFRSLVYLTNQPIPKTNVFTYHDKGFHDQYADPAEIIQYNFPCDFDVLSDIENGLNMDGTENVSMVSFNPFDYTKTLVGAQDMGCGLGGAVFDTTFTNQSTGPQAGTCETKSEIYYLRRQARLALLNQDKIAMQIVIPFNPGIFAGSMITANYVNKLNPSLLEYGSGDYLVVTASHSIKMGGFGTTTLDCVAKSVGLGRV